MWTRDFDKQHKKRLLEQKYTKIVLCKMKTSIILKWVVTFVLVVICCHELIHIVHNASKGKGCDSSADLNRGLIVTPSIPI